MPTAEERALYDRAIKSHEQSIPTLNDYLQKLLVLDTALIGGGFVVAKGDVLPYWCGVTVLTLLVASLAFVLYGLLPTMGFVTVHAAGGASAYRKFEVMVMMKKNRAMIGSSGWLILALIVGVGGLMAKGPPQPEEPKPMKVIVEQPAKS